MKRVIGTLIAAAIPALTAWCGGYNFDHRGEELVVCVVFGIGAALIAYACPVWDRSDD